MPYELPPGQLLGLGQLFQLGQLQQAGNQLLTQLVANHGMLYQGNPPCTWRSQWGQPERRALRLFRDMYGRKALWKYLHRGWVEYHAKDGRTYRVFRQAHKEVEVYQRLKMGKKMLYRLCLVDTEGVPLTDGVLKRLWLAKADPASLHASANVKSAS